MDTTKIMAKPRQRKPRALKKSIKVPAGEGRKRKSLIEDADLWASRFVRLRDMNDQGLVPCFTCGKLFYPKNIQNGHFVGRAHYSTRYVHMNMHGQCMKCNKFRSGEPGAYALHLIQLYGIEQVVNLLKLGTVDIVLSEEDLIDLRNSFKDATKRLLSMKGAKPWW